MKRLIWGVWMVACLASCQRQDPPATAGANDEIVIVTVEKMH